MVLRCVYCREIWRRRSRGIIFNPFYLRALAQVNAKPATKATEAAPLKKATPSKAKPPPAKKTTPAAPIVKARRESRPTSKETAAPAASKRRESPAPAPPPKKATPTPKPAVKAAPPPPKAAAKSKAPEPPPAPAPKASPKPSDLSLSDLAKDIAKVVKGTAKSPKPVHKETVTIKEKAAPKPRPAKAAPAPKKAEKPAKTIVKKAAPKPDKKDTAKESKQAPKKSRAKPTFVAVDCITGIKYSKAGKVLYEVKWVGGDSTWEPEANIGDDDLVDDFEEAQQKLVFGKQKIGLGDEVEVKNIDEGFQNSWTSAKVLKKMGKGDFEVEYASFVDSKGKKLTEQIEKKRLRLDPGDAPKEWTPVLGEIVEVSENDCWWEAQIKELKGKNAKVRRSFTGPCLNLFARVA